MLSVRSELRPIVYFVALHFFLSNLEPVLVFNRPSFVSHSSFLPGGWSSQQPARRRGALPVAMARCPRRQNSTFKHIHHSPHARAERDVLQLSQTSEEGSTERQMCDPCLGNCAEEFVPEGNAAAVDSFWRPTTPQHMQSTLGLK